jgi:hypothetical protein
MRHQAHRYSLRQTVCFLSPQTRAVTPVSVQKLLCCGSRAQVGSPE